jgi:hypothetical protein
MVILNNKPILAANRLGGRYTGLIGNLNVVINQSLITAKGLYLPKLKERNAKSITSKTGITNRLVKI